MIAGRSPASITCIEAGAVDLTSPSSLAARRRRRPVPVLGITGTGGSGKSSLTDELIRRFRLDQQDKLRWPCWPSTPPGDGAAERSSATASG